MSLASSLFLFWVTALALFVSVTSILAKADSPGRIFQVLFIPVTTYLIYILANHLSAKAPAFDRRGGWNRILIYYCFVVASALVVISFLSANTTPQLISALIFSPLGIYFLLLVWPGRKRSIDIDQISKHPDTAAVEAEVIAPPKLDVDRRDFLKLVGSAGISVFVYSLITRRAEPSFFGSVPSLSSVSVKDAAGNKIDPAEKSPTHGYYISEIDDSTIAYFGFVNKSGQWFIMRQDADNAYRYSKGDNDFSSHWTNRNLLSYDYFDNVF